MLSTEIKEFIIDKLNELYIKQAIIDKKENKKTYVLKSQCFSDLIDFFEKNF